MCILLNTDPYIRMLIWSWLIKPQVLRNSDNLTWSLEDLLAEEASSPGDLWGWAHAEWAGVGHSNKRLAVLVCVLVGNSKGHFAKWASFLRNLLPSFRIVDRWGMSPTPLSDSPGEDMIGSRRKRCNVASTPMTGHESQKHRAVGPATTWKGGGV